jgi:hypothetical protein
MVTLLYFRPTRDIPSCVCEREREVCRCGVPHAPADSANLPSNGGVTGETSLPARLPSNAPDLRTHAFFFFLHPTSLEPYIHPRMMLDGTEVLLKIVQYNKK